MSDLAFLDRYREIKRRLWSAPVTLPKADAPTPRRLPRDLLYVSSGPLPRDKPVWEPILTARDIAKAVLSEVCAKHNVAVHHVMSLRRSQHIVAARHEVCWRLREETNWSLPQIGRFLGRDHTSVLHACRSYEAFLRGEKYVQASKRKRALEYRRKQREARP